MKKKPKDNYLKKNKELKARLAEEENLLSAIKSGEMAGFVNGDKKPFRDERTLREKDVIYRTLVETTNTGYLIIDIYGRVIDANLEYVRLTGHDTLDEIRGRSVIEWTAPHEKKKNAQAVEKCKKDGYIRNFEISYVDKNGKITPIEVNATVVKIKRKWRIVTLCRDITERKRSEEALRESEERLRLANKATNDVVWDWDITKDTQQWNESGAVIFGWTDIVEHPQDAHWWSDRIHPEDLERVTNRFFAVVNNPEANYWHDEYRFRKAGGSYAEVMDRGYVLRDKEGKAIRMIGAMLDVTERKLTEEALRISEKRLQLALEISHSFAFEWYPEDDRVVRSESCASILGLSGEEVISDTGKKYFERVHPEDRERFVNLLKTLNPDMSSYQTEYRIIKKDGSVVVLYEVGYGTFNKDGKIAHLVGTSTDITDRKKVELQRESMLKALYESEERLRMHIENSPLAVVEWNDKFVVTRWAGEAENIFGFSASEIIGKSITEIDIVYPEDRPQVDSVMKRLTDGVKRKLILTNRNITKSGAVRYCAWHNSTLLDANGKLISVLSLVLDITDRKRDEEALKASEARLQLALVAAKAGIWECDINTNKNIWSDALWNIYGLKPHSLEPSYDAWLKTVDQDDRARVEKAVEDATQKGIELICEWRVIGDDGSVRWLMSQGQPIQDNSGIITRYIGVVMDITGLKQIEFEKEIAYKELEQYRQDLDRAQMVGQIGSWRLDVQLNVLKWSDENYRIFGIPKGTPLTYETFLSRIHPDDLHYVDTEWKRALAGNPYDIEHRILADGAVKWVREKAFLEFDHGGKLLGGFGITQDITERKINEETLQKNEEELKKLNRTLKALNDSSLAMTHADNEIEYLNLVCKIIVEDCGYSMVWIGFAEQDEEKKVRPIARAGFEKGYLETVNITWADTERGRGPIGTAIRTGKVSIVRDILTDPNFAPWREEAVKRGYASVIAFPLTVDNKTIGAATIYSKDSGLLTVNEIQLLSELITDVSYGIAALRLRARRAEAEEILRRDKDTFKRLVKERGRRLAKAEIELEKTRRLSDIGVLAATVAHELRNPLAAINMAVANVKRKAQNPILDKHLANIEKKVYESDQIINNLLYYSRIKSPNYESVNINSMLNECVAIIEEKITPLRKILINRNIDSTNDVIIEADPLQIKEVFYNLLNNSLDSIEGIDGKIDILTHNKDRFIEIIIQDNGIGIDKKHLHKIFDPFFTTKAKGTGLGLVVCKQITDLHGGTIKIESEVGKGSKAVILLPKKKVIKTPYKNIFLELLP